jgi:hypothetical protein
MTLFDATFDGDVAGGALRMAIYARATVSMHHLRVTTFRPRFAFRNFYG